MFGVLLGVIGTFFDEISSTIGKEKINNHEESIFVMGFLNSIWAVFGFLIYGLVTGDFIFSLASLPTFTIRALLEILLTYVVITAISKADRSTYGFIRVLSLPLLLIVDIAMGYALEFWQLAGIGVILCTLFLTFLSHGIKKDGALWCLASAIIAVATISLLKYNITYYNSVAAEQTFSLLIVATFLYSWSKYKQHEQPLKYLKKPAFLLQSILGSLAAIFISFAFKFAPPSVTTTAIRSSSIFWSVAVGSVYFKERHLAVKIASLALLCTGLILLII